MKSMFEKTNFRQVLVLIFMLSLILGACASEQAEFPSGEFNSQFKTITFHGDGTATFHDSAENSTTLGVLYTVDGNKISVADPADFGCGTDAGQYSWEYEGTTLSFELIEDNCLGREEFMAIEYSK
jgi:hypothetical protein